MEYDDEYTCLQGGYLYRTSRNVTGMSKLYPNPFSKNVTIVYNSEENAVLYVTDQLGRIVVKYSLEAGQINFTFSVSELEDGIYSYRISIKSGEMIDTGQFIVAK